MDTLFPYSQYVTGKNFVGRKTDTTLLGNLLSQGENIVIYEPPKTGKTSLREISVCISFSHFSGEKVPDRNASSNGSLTDAQSSCNRAEGIRAF